MTTKAKHEVGPDTLPIPVTAEELGAHESATTETTDIINAVHRTAQCMAEAIRAGAADVEDVRAVLLLVARATHPEPKACFEDAENFAATLARRVGRAGEFTQ